MVKWIKKRYLKAVQFLIKHLLHTKTIEATFLFVVFLMLSPTVSLPVLADTREPQVQVEAKLVEANSSHTRDLGVDWNHEDSSHGIGDIDMAHVRSLDRVGQLGNSGQTGNVFDFNPFNFSQNSSIPTPVLEEPKIQTQNNEQAKVSTSAQIPVIPQLQDSGINLSVTPQIQPDGTISMVVTPQTVSTDQPVMLGGLIQDNPEKDSNQVPALGKIPLLGRLFGNRSKESEKKNLMVFVTPTIVQPSDSDE